MFLVISPCWAEHLLNGDAVHCVAGLPDVVDSVPQDIYVKALGVGTSALRLTESPADDMGPAWSPDGKHVAFVRVSEQGGAIYTVPWPSGQERRLIDHDVDATWFFVGMYPALSWSPDGRWLAFHERPPGSPVNRIVRVSLYTREKQPLTAPPENTLGDMYPAFSPDGAWLAFARSSALFGGWDVWVQHVKGGEPRRLTSGPHLLISGLTWSPDGSEILYSTEVPSIHGVSVAGGEPRLLLGIGAALPSVRGNLLVHLQVTAPPRAIWRVAGRGAALRGREPEKLIASSQGEGNPAYSPDGRRIAFESRRSGATNIWLCDSDGRNPVQLTSFERSTGTPRWSPDGHRLAFDSLEAGDWNIYVVDADGGAPRRLTPEPSQEHAATWSRDGRLVYFQSNRSGSQQIWKMPSAGGPAVQVTRTGGTSALESWDGRYLYYTNSLVTSGIWRLPLDGGAETEVIRGPLRWSADWTLVRDGIYYAMVRRQGPRNEHTIQFFDFVSGRATEVFGQIGRSNYQLVAVSPDERWILYTEFPERQSELMLVENFR